MSCDFGNRPLRIGLAVLATGLAVGCGGSSDGPELVEVYGTVTMDGAPLPDATVQFTPEGGGDAEGVRLVAGRTDSSGDYTLEYSASRSGALPGKYKVSITTFREMEVGEDGLDIPGAPEKVPDVYNVNTTLTADVSPDKAEQNFDLDSSKGQVIAGQGGEDFGSDDE